MIALDRDERPIELDMRMAYAGHNRRQLHTGVVRGSRVDINDRIVLLIQGDHSLEVSERYPAETVRVAA